MGGNCPRRSTETCLVARECVMAKSDTPSFTLSPSEVVVLLSLHDWEYQPYDSVPDPALLEALPSAQGLPRAWSPVPLFLLKSVHSKDRIDVALCIESLVKLGLVEQSRTRTYLAGSWRLPGGRVLRADYQFSTRVPPPEHPAARLGAARLVDISIKIEGDAGYSCGVQFVDGNKRSFPCYSLTPNGLLWARRLATKGIPNDVLMLIAKMVEVSPKPPHRVYWDSRRAATNVHYEVQFESRLKYIPERSFVFVHAPDLGWDKTRAERTLSKAIELGLVICPLKDQYTEELMSGCEKHVTQSSRSPSLSEAGMRLACVAIGLLEETTPQITGSQDQGTKAPNSGRPKAKRGRPPIHDPVRDDKLYADWNASDHRTIKDFADARKLKETDVQRTIDRVEARRRSRARQAV